MLNQNYAKEALGCLDFIAIDSAQGQVPSKQTSSRSSARLQEVSLWLFYGSLILLDSK